MTKIAIIGSGSEGLEIARMLVETAKDRNIEIVVSNIGFNNPFEREPLKITANETLPELTNLYDKNGKLFELPKSKYHK